MASPLVLVVPLLVALWPSPRPTERIVLLPNADGKPSAVVVTSPKGEMLVDRPYLSASVYDSGAVKPLIDEPDAIRARYQNTLAALPDAAASYMLYFEPGSDRLLPESAQRLAALRVQLARRAEPEVALVGHADRGEQPGYNGQLSARRADAVRRSLVAAGIRDGSVASIALGSYQADGQRHNRRVEIRVR